MTTEWFERTNPGSTTDGWRRAIGRVQSDWASVEQLYDFYADITLDLIFGLPASVPSFARVYTFFVSTRVVVDSRIVGTPAPTVYEGLSDKRKFGEACLEETDTRGSIQYLNFPRQYLGSTAIFTPGVTRGGFPDTLPLVPLLAEWIQYPISGNSAMSGEWEYPTFGSVRMRPYDNVECRATVYWRAGSSISPQVTGAGSIISVFSV